MEGGDRARESREVRSEEGAHRETLAPSTSLEHQLYAVFRVLRALLLLTGFAALAVAVAYVGSEDPGDGLSVLLVGLGLLLLGAWAADVAPALWPLGCAALAVGFAAAGAFVAAALALGAWLVQAAYDVVSRRRYWQSYRDSELELTGASDEVPEEDRATVAALETGGYRLLGVSRWQLADDVGVTTLLVGRDRDRIASIAAGALELESRFGRRSLVTTMGPERSYPHPFVLRQRIPYGRYQNVQAAHQRALGILAVRGLRADRFATDEEVADYVRAGVEEFIHAVSTAPLRSYLPKAGFRNPIEHVLGDDERSRRRIDAWLRER